MEVLEDRIALATFLVVNSLDGPGRGPTGSLRDAITRADQSVGTNRVVITSKVDQPIVLTRGEIQIASNLSVENRSGHPVEIRQTTTGSRVFQILSGAADVTIHGVNRRTPITMTGGSISGANGGGILVDGTTNLTLISAALTANRVASGGGGGIYSAGGTVTLVGSSVTDNQAPDGSGGGISLEAGRVVVRDGSHVDGNSAWNIGGIRVNQGPDNRGDTRLPAPQRRRDAVQVLNGSSVSGNSSQATLNPEKGDFGGGGIAVESTGSVYVSASQVSDNLTVGMYSGGILVTLGNVYVTNRSRINGNKNNGPGGGIAANFLGTVTVTGGSQVNNNTGASLGGGIVNFASPAQKVVIERGSEVSNNILTNAQSVGETLFVFLDYLASKLNMSYQSLTGMTSQESRALIGQVEAEIASAHGADPGLVPPGLVLAGGGIGTLQGARVVIRGGSHVDGNYAGVRLPSSVPDGTPNSNSVGIGGGIATFLSRIDVDRSTVANNTSSEDGGGLWNLREVSITRSNVTGNTARGLTLGSLGGGLFLGLSRVESLISDSTFSQNAAAGMPGSGTQPPFGGFGGGVYNQGNLTIRGSSFSGNTATQHGGGLMNVGALAQLRLLGSRVTRNTSRLSGGGIFYNSSEPIQQRSQVVDNTPDDIASN
jgi:fibronectin-binding autotransporter adhesin